MKIGFISDTHGNLHWSKIALSYLKDCDYILHLGDVLAHGPRNDITGEYNPRELAEVFKAMDNIYFIRGNCDADVDEMVMDKDISKSECLFEFDGIKIYATHGYLESDNTRIYKGVELGADIVAYGHSHIKVLEKLEDIIVLNPGSTTLPKDGSKSIAIYEDGHLKLIDIEKDKIIKELKV